MAGILTRDTIISNGCQLGGNPNLGRTTAGAVTSSLGDTFLNLLLDHVYRGWDWAFLKKITTALADTSDFSKIPASALPADYGRIQKLRPRSVNASSWLEQKNNIEDLWLQRRMDSENSASATTAPSCFSVDEGSGSGGTPDLYVYPTPSARLTYDIIYFAKPATLTSDVAPSFPHHLALVYAVANWAKDFQRDTTEIMAKTAADQIIAQYRTNHHDKGRSDPMVLPFDKRTYPDYAAD